MLTTFRAYVSPSSLERSPVILPRDLHRLGSAAWRLCIFSATTGCPVTMVHVAGFHRVLVPVRVFSTFPLTTKSPTTHVTISHASQEIPQSPPVTKAECLHQPGCSPPLHATDHLGLVGARTARHDREPGGPQLCSGPLVRVRVSLAEEKGHQVTALLAELIAESSISKSEVRRAPRICRRLWTAVDLPAKVSFRGQPHGVRRSPLSCSRRDRARA